MDRKYRYRRLSILLALILVMTSVFAQVPSVHAVGKLKLNKTQITLVKGKKVTLKVRGISAKKITSSVRFSTSNKRVATVSKKGVITAKQKGMAVIRVKSKNGKSTAKCKVTVKNSTEKKKIQVVSGGYTIVYELNNSTAAEELYKQLPLTIKVENYSDDEKIFYPPKKLSTKKTPRANAKAGTLGYYAPWGDVVMFYGDFGSANGLYELGEVIASGEYIGTLSGEITITLDNSIE